MKERHTVTVATVTFNSEAELPGYFDVLARLEYAPFNVVMVDCASSDDSVEVARAEAARRSVPCRVIPLEENRGFTGGMNEALLASDAPLILALNPDARPEPAFLTELVRVLLARPHTAAATGKLLRPLDETAGEAETPTLDACGMHLTRTWRHLDRGSGEPDDGRFDRPERVFGATGAAVLLRRDALEDVAIEGMVFDEAFHSFREDAELAFRFQERGWEVIYQPAARAVHRRTNLPSRRTQMPAAVNYHSLKNRYLLRLYHQTGRNFLRTLLPTLFRDLAALAWVLVRERTSLPAYAWLWKHRHEILDRRRRIQSRVTRPPHELDGWFSSSGEPV